MVNTKKMRVASFLLPDPGGEVVRECLGEIERMGVRVAGLEGDCLVAQAKHAVAERRLADLQEAVRHLRKVENDEHTFNPGHWVEQRLVWQEKRDAARAAVDALVGEG
jgi:hypothetical protein